MNILSDNGNSHQLSVEQSEKSTLASETHKTPTKLTPPTMDQKRGKPDRGVKRGIKNKQTETSESAGIKLVDPKPCTKGDQTPEPIAKRTVRPSKNTKDPAVASEPVQEPLAKPVVNEKPVARASCGSPFPSTAARESQVESQVKGQVRQGSPRGKGADIKPEKQLQVRVMNS